MPVMIVLAVIVIAIIVAVLVATGVVNLGAAQPSVESVNALAEAALTTGMEGL